MSAETSAAKAATGAAQPHAGLLGYDPWAPNDPVRPAAADFIRVVATGTVGWYHIWQQSWVGAGALDYWPRSGAAMVDVLVMLSAFCLFLPYANAAASGQEPPPLEPLRFYRKRAVRIMPSYYVNIVTSLLLRALYYGWNTSLVLDFVAHLFFAQTFFPVSYTLSQLNGVTWTLTVFALFYLLFPFLARWACKAPVQTLALLLAEQWAWTHWVLKTYDTGRYYMLYNQFPAFGGVFAVGFAGAWALAYLSRRPSLQTKSARVAFTLLGLAAFYAMSRLLRLQAASEEYRRFMLSDRMPLVLAAAACMVCLALGVTLPFRSVWRWLAGISYNFYLWHQMLAVFLKYDLHWPTWTGETPPNQLGDTIWMHQSNALYWVVALSAAVFFTYAVERPLARRLTKKKEVPQPQHSK